MSSQLAFARDMLVGGVVLVSYGVSQGLKNATKDYHPSRDAANSTSHEKKKDEGVEVIDYSWSESEGVVYSMANENTPAATKVLGELGDSSAPMVDMPLPNVEMPLPDTKLHLLDHERRDFDVKVSQGGHGAPRITVPFPFSLVFGEGYLLHSMMSSDDTPREYANKKAERSSTTAAMPPPYNDQEDDDDDDNPMKSLEENDVEEIYKKLMERAGAKESPGSNKTIWENKNFRVDVGHVDHKKGVRNWEFQVNKDAEKYIKKRFLKNGNTHKKLFRGKFNFKKPPSLEEWKSEIKY